MIRDRSVHAQNDVQSVTQQILLCTETVKAGRLLSVRHTMSVRDELQSGALRCAELTAYYQLLLVASITVIIAHIRVIM